MTAGHPTVPAAWRTPGHLPDTIRLGPRFPMIRVQQADGTTRYRHVDPDSIECTPERGFRFTAYDTAPQPESVREGGAPEWGPDQPPAEVGPEVTMTLPDTASIGPFLLTERDS
ncbi:hypothetical protein Q8791_23565 [Nocardiopsis sp. CT-R113]|uniref:Uncharacterized protein n=1 Tax=Nocardiopsis codii TaxID=3065942 RepID=A0ABU7KD89_9ACTN|nr:hypothetical protein [Nocardiopsis sp. CT-R113]MEE2040200.1 hypothetical protein [Nocardiopsis sp. CT-R113]